ncbi:hypothetical protein GCM10018781_40580 [Kitasatospora indigofera]|uniref:Uncharacterized protein n=1 Tax=Kitasatospora indigofera TaxID=67307 RepID=A0A919KWD8_9ACTN|nr:hypothetical protein GCM10018781_40580 [Kitasatospora indigofera]
MLGWSQGGGAGLFVGQDSPAYSPGLDLVGVAALAPAADLGPQFAGRAPPGPRNDSSESHNAALRINVYRGFLAAYPELRATDACSSLPASRHWRATGSPASSTSPT